MNEQEGQAGIVRALSAGRGFPDSASDLHVIETHISWVFLAGSHAYKLKKAVRLNFLDFTGLERRRCLCKEELRLNRVWAPELYLDVLPVGGDYDRPEIGGDGKAIEYVLRMRRFPQSARLDHQLISGELGLADMRALAETVAELHTRARPIPFTDDVHAFARPAKAIEDNYPHVERTAPADVLAKIRGWTQRELIRRKACIVGRHRDGFVREVHGDLHLANLVRLDHRIAAFDCVEFSAELRNIDVVSDTTFLVMDLAARRRLDLAYAFLNRYLEITGDYAGMRLLDLYLVYHCMIRAKVASIRWGNRADESGREQDIAEVRRYLRLALSWIDDRRPMLVATHGYSASGKSWLAERLARSLPAIRIRTDIERKRMLGLDETETTGSAVGEGVYTNAARGQVYDHVADVAGGLLRAGHSVILDASLLRREFRDRIRRLAARCGAPLTIVSATAADDELDRRLREREANAGEVSEADRRVLADQRNNSDPLDAAEAHQVMIVETDRDIDLAALADRIKAAN